MAQGTAERRLASEIISVTYTLTFGRSMTQPKLASAAWFECLEINLAGTQEGGQEPLDLGVELDHLGDKDLKQVGKQTLVE